MPLELTNCLEGHSDRVWNVSWHHQGNLIASCGGDKSVRIWGKEGDRWICKSVLSDHHNRTVRSVSWSPCGNFLAAASFDATVSVWDRKNGEFECVATLEGHENEVKSVSWSSDGAYLATCSRDKSVWIWEVEDEDYECASVLSKHSQDVKKVLWHPSANILASCSYDDTINMYKEEDDDWTCFSTLTGHSSTVWSIAFDATGERLVSCSDDNTLKIWQCYYPGNMEGVQTLGREPTWKSVCSLSGYHSRTIYDVDWSHQSGLIASASGDDSVKIFQEDRVAGTKGEPIFNVVDTIERAHAQDVNCVKWSPADGSVLATCSDDSTVKLWKLVL